MGIVLESLNERDRRMKRERRVRTVAWIGGYVIAVLFGAVIAGPAGMVHGFDRGVEVEKRRAALAPKPTHPQPASALTQWKCTTQEFKEHREACKNRALSELRFNKPSKE
jgi:hypothetical protein